VKTIERREEKGRPVRPHADGKGGRGRVRRWLILLTAGRGGGGGGGAGSFEIERGGKGERGKGGQLAVDVNFPSRSGLR